MGISSFLIRGVGSSQSSPDTNSLKKCLFQQHKSFPSSTPHFQQAVNVLGPAGAIPVRSLGVKPKIPKKSQIPAMVPIPKSSPGCHLAQALSLGGPCSAGGWQPSTPLTPRALSQWPWLMSGHSKGSCRVSQQSPCSVQDPYGAGGPWQPLPWSQAPSREGVLPTVGSGLGLDPPKGSLGWTQGQVSPARTLHGQSLFRSETPCQGPDPGPRPS